MRRRRMIARGHDAGRYARSEPFEIFHRPQRSLPARLAGLTVRMRAEITFTVGALLAWGWLTDRLPRWGAVTVVVVLVAAVALVGPARRYVLRRGLAVLTRHRLRAAFVERRVMNYTGNLPILLWARPTVVGERVWVLLRAGICAADLEHNLDHIASTCLARSATAAPVRSMVALVVVDVTRRDPLAAGAPVRSVLTPTLTRADRHWLRRVSAGKEATS